MPAPRLPFDWIGTQMWSICKMLENDFDRFAAKDVMEFRPRFEGSKSLFLTNMIYNTTFYHDYGKEAAKGEKSAITDATWLKVEEDYQRRIERFNGLLRLAKENNRTLLFVRLEPDKKPRVAYPEFAQEHDERHFLEVFSRIMRDKGVRCMVLYMTTTYDRAFDRENGICYVKYGVVDPNKVLSGEDVHAIYMANAGFIRSCINSVESRL